MKSSSKKKNITYLKNKIEIETYEISYLKIYNTRTKYKHYICHRMVNPALFEGPNNFHFYHHGSHVSGPKDFCDIKILPDGKIIRYIPTKCVEHPDIHNGFDYFEYHSEYLIDDFTVADWYQYYIDPRMNAIFGTTNAKIKRYNSKYHRSQHREPACKISANYQHHQQIPVWEDQSSKQIEYKLYNRIIMDKKSFEYLKKVYCLK